MQSGQRPGSREIAAAAMCLLSTVALAPPGRQEGSWSRFRGPNGSGVAEVTGLPVEFGPETNVVWSQTIPAGKSSPVLGDDHVFLTAFDEGMFVVLAFDRETGELAWRVALQPGEAGERTLRNDGAVASPVTDGDNVFSVFGNFGVIALGPTGEELWRVPMDPLGTFYGHAASPVLAGNTLILLLDQYVGSALLGLDRLTGEVLWRRERPGRVESWTTPALYPNEEDPEQILVVGSTWLDAYALTTGEPFWETDVLGYWPIASPVVSGDVLVTSVPDMAGGEPASFASVLGEGDADGDGTVSLEELLQTESLKDYATAFAFIDIDADGLMDEAEYTASFLAPVTDNYGAVGLRLPAPGSGGTGEVLWREQRAVPYHATPLVSDGLAYLISDNGILSVVDLATGELARRDRLSRAGANLNASPVLGDGKIYVATADGEVIVLRAGADWEVLASNDLGEPMFATPALAPGMIFVRTDGHLYAFGVEIE